jgi:hypothetical protein
VQPRCRLHTYITLGGPHACPVLPLFWPHLDIMMTITETNFADSTALKHCTSISLTRDQD